MRIAILIAAFSLSASGAPAAPAPDKARAPNGATPARVVSPTPNRCPPLSRHATGNRGTGTWREYDCRNPPLAHLAVVRIVDGCPVPVLAGRPR